MFKNSIRGKNQVKVNTLFLLSLAIFPLITLDFLPISLVLIFVSILILRIFISFPQLVIYIISISIVFYIKSLFGTLIIPESTISFLATMCLARIMAKDNTDHRINRLLGFLWAGCFILFRTDLLAIISLIFVTLLILKTFKYKDNERLNFKQLFLIQDIKIKDIFIGIVLVITLFIFFPRIYNFLPGVRNQTIGQIGYSKTIDNSSAGKLNPSSQTAFIAQIKQLPNEILYWRGRVHSYTDGFNWRPLKMVNRNMSMISNNIHKKIDYTIKYEQNFDGDLILLDIPITINESNIRFYKDNEFHTFRAYSKKEKGFIKATSTLSLKQLTFDKKNRDKYTQLPGLITKNLDSLINRLIKIETLEGLLIEFKNYLNEEEFYYTLSPKNSITLKNFLINKQGFCTHYASLLGIVLRKLGYPTRLVSGFQGGTYNLIGKHYRISSNDAHVWVEVYNGNYWQRVDPTSYISPERILRGGESFFTGSQIISKTKNMNFLSSLYYNTKQYWDNLNYKVSLFLDTYDREKQKHLSNSLKLKRYVFIILGFLFFIAVGFIFYFLNRKSSPHKDLVDINFDKFIKKLNKYHVKIEDTDNLEQIKYKIKRSKIVHKSDYFKYISLYEKVKYSKNKDQDELKTYIRNLK